MTGARIITEKSRERAKVGRRQIVFTGEYFLLQKNSGAAGRATSVKKIKDEK